jgi:hypothetical protein
VNNTDQSIHFDYRWGNWDRESLTIRSGVEHWFSWTFEDGTRTSPNFQIRFDESLLNDSEIYREYVLEQYANAEQSCNGAYHYEFDYITSTRVGLFDIED